MKTVNDVFDAEAMTRARDAVVSCSRFSNTEIQNSTILTFLMQQQITKAAFGHNPVPEFAFQGTPDLLLQHGLVFPERLPEDAFPDHMRGVSRQCYYNSLMAASAQPDRLVYCEGVAYPGLIPVDHAWVFDLDTGAIWDPTWSVAVQGERLKNAQYVGIPIKLNIVADRATRSDWCMLDDWREGWPILSGHLPLDEALDRRVHEVLENQQAEENECSGAPSP